MGKIITLLCGALLVVGTAYTIVIGSLAPYLAQIIRGLEALAKLVN